MDFYLPLILFCISTAITPGPNNLMIMMSTLHFGVKKSLPHLLGICIGFPVMVICIGTGLAFVFTHYPAVHWTIKIIGAIYILWLAWKIMSTPLKLSNETKRKPLHFFQAALFQWANPKAWVMAIGAISTYTSAKMELNLHVQVLIIALFYLIISTFSAGAWMLGGYAFKRILSNEVHQRIFSLVLGLLLAFSIIIIIV